MSKSRQISSNLILATSIFTVLSALYLLSYSGVFHSGDEIFYVLNAMDFIQGNTASIGKGGPYVVVIGLVTRVLEVLGVDARLQVLFLINIPITALTAVFLFLLVVELGYEARIAVLVALLFGLTTPAWVYSKALFREPWAALGLAAALFFVVRFRRRKAPWDLVLGMLSLALAVTTRTSTAVVLPFFLVYVAAAVRNSTMGHYNLSRQLKLALLLLLSVLTALGLWLIIDAYHPLATRLFQSLTDPQPLAGILISPGRGLFVYSPLLLLSVASLGIFYRRHPGETVLIVGSVVAYVLILAAWPKWWGGWGWGPRFLVPFVPFLILPLAATLEKALAQRRWLWLGVLVFLLALIGAVIQVTGVLVGPSMPAFNLDTPELTFDLSSSPLAWWLAVWDQGSLDVAWLQMGNRLGRVLLVFLSLALVVVLGAVLIRRNVAIRTVDRRSGMAVAAGLLLLLGLVTAWSNHTYSRFDQRYLSPAGFIEGVEYVLDRLQPGDILVVEREQRNVAPLIAFQDGSRVQDPHIYRSRTFNRCLGNCPPYDEVIRDEWRLRPDANAWIQGITGDYRRTWFITTDVNSHESRAIELALDEVTYKQECQWLAQDIRLCLYNNPMPSSSSWIEQELNAVVGDAIHLTHFMIGDEHAQAYQMTNRFVAGAGDTMFVRLIWQARAPLSEDYKVSLQLLDSGGRLRQQIDRQPVDGFRTTSSWQVGEAIPDRLSLVLAPDLEPGLYDLNLVVYDPDSLRRLSIQTGDSMLLTTVQIR